MATTFRALCDLADWSKPESEETKKDRNVMTEKVVKDEVKEVSTPSIAGKEMNLHCNIQIHLPETTNMAVYDAIFQSLKKHLM